MMTCQEALALLYDILDKEASEVDTKEVQAHIKSCKHCAEIYRVEREVNEFIRSRANDTAPAEKLDSLKSKIGSLLDAEDRERPDPFVPSRDGSPARPTSISRAIRYVAAAAALVVLVWAALTTSDLLRHKDAYAAIEDMHLEAAGTVASYASVGSTESALSTCLESMNYALAESFERFDLVGGKLVDVDGCEMGHFVYTRGDTAVSVFVAPAHSFTIPDELRAHKVTFDGQTFYDHNCRGCRLLFHEVGDVVVITATGCRELDLRRVVPGQSSV